MPPFIVEHKRNGADWRRKGTYPTAAQAARAAQAHRRAGIMTRASDGKVIIDPPPEPPQE